MGGGGRAKDMWFAVLLSGSGSVQVQRVLNFRGLYVHGVFRFREFSSSESVHGSGSGSVQVKSPQ